MKLLLYQGIWGRWGSAGAAAQANSQSQHIMQGQPFSKLMKMLAAGVAEPLQTRQHQP